MKHVVSVLIPGWLDRAFDYATADEISPGALVRVPFGRKVATGVVWGEADGNVPPGKLKSIAAVYDHLPPLSKELREFVDWVARYTLSPPAAVLKMALPVEDALKPPTAREKKFDASA